MRKEKFYRAPEAVVFGLSAGLYYLSKFSGDVTSEVLDLIGVDTPMEVEIIND